MSQASREERVRLSSTCAALESRVDLSSRDLRRLARARKVASRPRASVRQVRRAQHSLGAAFRREKKRASRFEIPWILGLVFFAMAVFGDFASGFSWAGVHPKTLLAVIEDPDLRVAWVLVVLLSLAAISFWARRGREDD